MCTAGIDIKGKAIGAAARVLVVSERRVQYNTAKVQLT